jgi:hypothetical protein
MTSDHRVAGSSPAGCNVLRDLCQESRSRSSKVLMTAFSTSYRNQTFAGWSPVWRFALRLKTDAHLAGKISRLQAMLLVKGVTLSRIPIDSPDVTS